jgi:hypothetical protein
MTTSNSPWTSKVVGAMGITGALVVLAFLLDHPAHRVGTHSGVVMGTYAPGKSLTGMGTIQVELDNDAIVLASIPMRDDFPTRQVPPSKSPRGIACFWKTFP